MPCANDQFTVIPVSVATQLHPWEGGFGSGGVWLFLSDSPEEVPAGVPDPSVLYRCVIPFPATGIIDINAFLWHINRDAQTKNLRLVFQVASPGGYAGEFNGHLYITSTGSPQPVGLCIALAQLSDTLDAASPG